MFIGADDNLFGSSTQVEPSGDAGEDDFLSSHSSSRSSSKASAQPTVTKAPAGAGLFDEDEEEDLFAGVSVKKETKRGRFNCYH